MTVMAAEGAAGAGAGARAGGGAEIGAAGGGAGGQAVLPGMLGNQDSDHGEREASKGVLLAIAIVLLWLAWLAFSSRWKAATC